MTSSPLWTVHLRWSSPPAAAEAAIAAEVGGGVDLARVGRALGLDPATIRLNGYFLSRGPGHVSSAVTWRALLAFFAARGLPTGADPAAPIAVNGKPALSPPPSGAPLFFGYAEHSVLLWLLRNRESLIDATTKKQQGWKVYAYFLTFTLSTAAVETILSDREVTYVGCLIMIVNFCALCGKPYPRILSFICAQSENPCWKPKNVLRRASSKRTAHLCQNLLMSYLAMTSPLA